MQEVFEKLIDKFANIYRVVKNDEDLEWNRAVYRCTEIVKQAVAECSNGHFGCNTNGEHERCDGCGLIDCKNRNKIWFGAVDDGNDTNVGSNGWIPVSERLPDEAFGCLVTVIDCEPSTQNEFENILPYFVGYDGQGWIDADGEEIPFEVIAWQPLPLPFRDKE